MPMKTKRAESVAVSFKNCIYVIGGRDDNGNSLKSIEKYDTVKKVWEEMPEMLIARRGLTAQAIKEDIYVFGGFDGDKFLCSVEK